jgi:hypothetical protein
MSIDKSKFDKLNEGGFYPEYYEEYKGYQFAISLSETGYRDVGILFPKGVKVHEQYLAFDARNTIESNWFTRLAIRKFMTREYSGISVDESYQIFVPRDIGLIRDPNSNYITFIREVDLAAVEKKYKDHIDSSPNIRDDFDRFRKYNNKIEELVDSGNRTGCQELLPKNVDIIYDFSQDDVILLTREFIDEIIEHDNKRKHHARLLNKIKQNYESRRFKIYE